MDFTGSELDNEITILVYNSDKIELELDGDAEVKASYTYGSRLIKSETAYYVFNGYLDIVQFTDLGGLVIRDYDYDPYGVQLINGEDDTNPFRYKSEYHDAGTGLIYLKNRFYDPSIGRFISLDPIRDGLNWYAYAGNNPVMFVDSSGLVAVNFVDYITAQGGKVVNTAKGIVSVTVGSTTTFWTLNSGIMDDAEINTKFGFSSVLSERERMAEVGLSISNGTISKVYPKTFSTMDSAAAMFGLLYQDEAQSLNSFTIHGTFANKKITHVDGKEAGAFIHQVVGVRVNAAGELEEYVYYELGDVFWGVHEFVGLGVFTERMSGSTARPVTGMVHTHPSGIYVSSDEFSPQDLFIGNTYHRNGQGISSVYAITPRAGIIRYDRGTTSSYSICP